MQKDITGARQALAEDGYVLLKDAASPELITYLVSHYDRCDAGEIADLAGGYIPGKKRQFLFDFPDDQTREDFRNQISTLVGYDPKQLTISERHIKAYDDSAPARPAPHKDRAASTYSVGIPIILPEGTSVCMFPALDRTSNPNERAAFLTELQRGEIDALYETSDAVHLNEGVGDIVVFEGSALYHERANPAGSVVLYIKINDQGLDPLGENVFATTG